MRRRRLLASAVFSVVAITGLTAILEGITPAPNLPTDLLLFLAIVVGSALIGGFIAGAATAIVSFPVIIWFLTVPVHTFRIEGGEDVAALFVFFSVSIIVSALVDQVARRSADAQSARDQAAELAIAAARAETAAEGDRLRTAILRAVSHDLRTPLSSIKASASSLLQDDIEWSSHDRHEFLTTIEEEADRLDRIVGNLLDLSRLEAGVVHPVLATISVEVAIRDAIASLSTDSATIVVSIAQDDLEVAADEILLERAIANIVANAVRHGSVDEPIEIRARRSAENVEITVIDHGPGMAADDREQVFEPFRQLGDRSAGAGTGLGLAVARGFIDAMDGTIVLDETPGGGLTATISLLSPGTISRAADVRTRSVTLR